MLSLLGISGFESPNFLIFCSVQLFNFYYLPASNSCFIFIRTFLVEFFIFFLFSFSEIASLFIWYDFRHLTLLLHISLTAIRFSWSNK